VQVESESDLANRITMTELVGLTPEGMQGRVMAFLECDNSVLLREPCGMVDNKFG